MQRSFTQRLLNCDLGWPRQPASVKSICEAEKESYIWMRYDIPRVEALFSRCIWLMGDASFRTLVKNHCPELENHNNRLNSLRIELEELHSRTVLSIRTRGVFDSMTELQREAYYAQHEHEIQKKFLEAAGAGTLGQLPPPRHRDGSHG